MTLNEGHLLRFMSQDPDCTKSRRNKPATSSPYLPSTDCCRPCNEHTTPRSTFPLSRMPTVSYFHSIIKSGGFVGITFTNKSRADQIRRVVLPSSPESFILLSPVLFKTKHWNTAHKFIILPVVLYGRELISQFKGRT